jgi:predicted metalloendopeptidase
VEKQFSAIEIEEGLNLDGKLVLGEAIADLGGLGLAHDALAAKLAKGSEPPKEIDGFTPEQRVFLGWAQVWCENARPEAERLKAATNPHSSNKYRVNGPMSNMPEFQKAFSCKANAPMIRTSACRVW